MENQFKLNHDLGLLYFRPDEHQRALKFFDDRPRLKKKLKPAVQALRRSYGRFRNAMGNRALRKLGPLAFGAGTAAALHGFPPGPDGLRWTGTFLGASALCWWLWKNYLIVRPLNQIVRYYSILELLDSLKGLFSPHPRILEAGSGPEGLGHLVPYPFWGSDLRLDGIVNSNMTFLQASATELPFEAGSFDLVLSMDTIEHIPTQALREQAIDSMWRVAKRAVIVGYPAGNKSHQSDKDLHAYYRQKGFRVPDWLEEHIANGVPTDNFLESFWKNRSPFLLIPNEPQGFHLWMMKREANPIWLYTFMGVILLVGPLLRFFNRKLWVPNDSYRRIYVLAKDPEVIAAIESDKRFRGKLITNATPR